MKKVYFPEEHHIPLNKISKEALLVISKLQVAGHTAYLVGGSVRDLILGTEPQDFDVSTSASPEEIRSLFKNCYLVGKRFRLAHVRFQNVIIEVSTFRSGDIECEDLIVRDNEYGSEEEDVLRRDFTINGLFYDPTQQLLIDYVNGFEDLKKSLLVAIGNPHHRFRQDPVRMIRLIKFYARLGFSIEEETHLALLHHRKEILKSAPARVLEEILRMLESGFAYPFFSHMAEFGFLTHLLPALSAYCEIAKKNELYLFLKKIDAIHKSTGSFDRHVLLTLLVFPIFERHIHLLFQKQSREISLSTIYEEALFILKEVFSPFIKLTKKMFAITAYILASQFKLLPLQGKTKRLRLPKNREFLLAIDFLYLRSCIDPTLIEQMPHWEEVMLLRNTISNLHE